MQLHLARSQPANAHCSYNQDPCTMAGRSTWASCLRKRGHYPTCITHGSKLQECFPSPRCETTQSFNWQHLWSSHVLRAHDISILVDAQDLMIGACAAQIMPRHLMSITFRSSASLAKDMTSAPTMGAQESSVMTFFTVGLFLPCSVTMLAIWITGSFSASGKCPCT